MRLIDADACEPYFYEHMDDKAMVGAMNAVDEMPTIDAVEVVRCKDCTNWGRSPFGCSTTMGWCKLAGEHRRPDYYCASGERRRRDKDE